jgi:hypothetical protein
MSSGLVARCGVRVLERAFRGLAHCPCSRSTRRGIEVLVPDSPVEMLPAGDGGAERNAGGCQVPPTSLIFAVIVYIYIGTTL